MEINISQENGMLVVTLIGELDEHSAEFVRNAVDSRICACARSDGRQNF